ncbi:Response regulator of the LytR/AlgR family protein [Cesiribacter andamanensis AMV16]|uniref:Response regulator of the LytR/AlgR family protein n=1 Tax=Cesiribacter andamanensis AMV16 TaxID=1279009 RepID=M7N477_9BACT|nr:Response regulator of the LytR/AlgR family protein [Cesiribacter andamanensis AMV16]
MGVLLCIHLIKPANFPTAPDYSFPLTDFLVSFIGSAILWEIQLFNFRHIYNRFLSQRGFSPRLVWRVVGTNLLFSLVFYLLYAPLVTRFVYHQPLVLFSLLSGLFISLLFALLLNFAYLGAELYHSWKAGVLEPGKATEALLAAESRPSLLRINSGRQLLQVSPDEIAWFQSENKLVFAMLHTGKKVLTSYTLAELEELLKPDAFFKINRQLIAHRKAVYSVKKDQNYKLLVQLRTAVHSSESAFPEQSISRYKAAEFKEWLSSETPAQPAIHHSA